MKLVNPCVEDRTIVETLKISCFYITIVSMKILPLFITVFFISCTFDVAGLEEINNSTSCSGESPLSDVQNGICINLHKICVGGKWEEPDYLQIPNYESVETLCDLMDNDCDGVVDAGECGENSSCGYSEIIACFCNEGYELDSGLCVDINECDDTPCHENATCTNSTGGFSCECNSGYDGDGFICSDTDECEPNPCHADANCINIADSYECSCKIGFEGDGITCHANSCKIIRDFYPATIDGTYTIDTGAGGPLDVFCDMTSDFQTGYTMVKFSHPNLIGDQDAYRSLCATHGMEIIVPRTRAHALAIKSWLGGKYPPLVNVFPKYNGAVGLENFQGRCMGAPCSFYLSNSHTSYDNVEPNGNNTTDYSLYLWFDNVGNWGGWDDWDNRVDSQFYGWAVCSTNDNPQPPILTDCTDYSKSGSVWNRGINGISGVYKINPTGNAVMEAYCDQRMDGGGWTLVLNYVHKGGTNPSLSVKTDAFPLLLSSSLGVDESSVSENWGHASNTLLSQFEISEVRFYGISDTGRTIDFSTVSESCIEYMQTGAGNCRSFRDNYHGLWTQNAYLPQGIDEGFVNQGDYALTEFPFYESYNYHWGIKGLGTRWEVDNFTGDGSQNTIHRVYIRTKPKGASCNAIKNLYPGVLSGYYSIDPDGSGGESSFITYCEMDKDGGGWTLVALYGKGFSRPTKWSGLDYQRPGASFFNSDTTGVTIDRRVMNAALNDGNFASFSINASTLWVNSNHEILGYVGGSTDDYIVAELPWGCNYFDGSTWCEENTFGPFELFSSSGVLLTDNAYACTTAHRNAPYQNDPYDEFGLHIQDGLDVLPSLNCANTASTVGHQNIGRIFTTFESSDGNYWNDGVTSHWNESGQLFQSGALFVR
jgi:EGF domain